MMQNVGRRLGEKEGREKKIEKRGDVLFLGLTNWNCSHGSMALNKIKVIAKFQQLSSSSNAFSVSLT